MDKYANVILVGTKIDKADDDDRHCFRTQVAHEFFDHAESRTGPVALVHKDDFSQLKETILSLPNVALKYEQIEETGFGTALGELLGLDATQVMQELREARADLERELQRAQAAAEQERAMRF